MEGLKSVIAPQNSEPTPTFFSNPEEGLAIVDNNGPAITTINKGKEITGTIVDGGSRVNVISQRTCDNLGITECEPCPFWLRMADTGSVRPTGLIRNLEITIGACFPNIRGSLATQCVGSVPPVVRETMAKDGAYKAKLAEERHYLS